MGMTANLCARHPRRSGALNGAVALTDGFGKMIGPALVAPLFALAISPSPQTHAAANAASQTRSGDAPSIAPLAFFCALGGLFVALGAAGCLLPSSVDGVDSSGTRGSQAFRQLQEES
jgi:hypothetical protein